jgi:MFS family permease
MGAFWGLGPTYAGQLGLDRGGIAWFMVATIMGGALLQWPLGRLSDRVDRRIGLALAGALAAGVALAAGLVATWSTGMLFATFFAYGGLVFSIYPMSVAHMLDTLPADDLLAGCSSLLLVHGIGAMFGPALAGLAMARSGPSALPLYFSAVLGLLVLYLLLRLSAHRRTRPHPAQFHPMLRTTPGALGLLAETESDPPRKENH